MWHVYLLVGFSLLLTVSFIVYAANHYYLLNAARRYVSPPLPDLPGFRPTVCVHLPVYNEKYVIARLLAGCTRMAERYGVERVRILVLDDSTDGTSSEIDRLADGYSKAGFRIEVLRRDNRAGFKAGALQAALDHTQEDFIAVFDADFLPLDSFLQRTLPHFGQDPSLGIVQTRWSHLNRNYNLLTRAIAIGIDVHFLVEQTGRFADGCYQNFNGSGGVLRRSAVLEAGGWQADTLAEDLDLSYRMQHRGYRVLYLKDVVTPGEVPLTVPSFKKQQSRWACGSLRTARKILPGLLRDRNVDGKKRLEALLHLTGYMIHPLMLMSFLVACLATILGLGNSVFSLHIPFSSLHTPGSLANVTAADLRLMFWGPLVTVIVGCTVAPWISSIVTLKRQHLPVVRNLPSLLILFLLGCGIGLVNTIAAAKALLTRREWEFTRTPKYASLNDSGDWRSKVYQVPLDREWAGEILVAGLGLVAIFHAISDSALVSLILLVPYTSAYAFILAMTALQSRRGRTS
jgi:cellulose synthase/poly-beta-1,6-N-acetylglucosamine synthase-like glycosyltransferase